jgi:hypothetical protein
MLTLHTATVLPFPAAAAGAEPRVGATGDATPDNVVPMRGNVVMLAELVQRRLGRAGGIGLVPPVGGDAA